MKWKIDFDAFHQKVKGNPDLVISTLSEMRKDHYEALNLKECSYCGAWVKPNRLARHLRRNH